MQGLKPVSRRRILSIILRLLGLLVKFRIGDFISLLRLILYRLTDWRWLKPEVNPAKKLAMIHSMLELTEELQHILGEGLLAELMSQLIYKANKKYELLAVLNTQGVRQLKPSKNKTRTWPDRSRETFVKIGKTSPGLSPP